ncbi:MAG: methyltransferase [Candidatus Wallbacteria bacterium]|nr:methyltransferase [Candidatus Wallbacteria bacterium]
MRIDSLTVGGMKIAQDKELFCLNIDSVLLANFPRLSSVRRVIEFGSGTGGVLLMLHCRKEKIDITGVEQDPRAFDCLLRTVEINDLKASVKLVPGDFRDIPSSCDQSFDMVIANPPYLSAVTKKRPAGGHRLAAKVEMYGTFSDYCASARKVLRKRGRFVFIHRSDRLPELAATLSGHGIEMKLLRFVHSFSVSEGQKFLCEAVKGGQPGCRVMPPLIVYAGKSVYTDEVLGYYRR